MKELEEVWSKVPDALKESDLYCFYVSNSYKNVPKTYNSKKVIVIYILQKDCVYYAPKMFE
jgi:hypothetical protein